MFGKSHIQIGAGRYYQHHGAVSLLGAEAAYYGKRAFVLYSDAVVYKKTAEKINDSLKQSDLEYKDLIFEGPSTQNSFEYVAGLVNEYDADVVIGVGGGRIIDIAKAASDIANKRIITVPTSAATCAAFAILYVVYGEDGSVEKSGFLNHEISAVIVDTDFVLDDCPKRYLASGIADAMSKNPEFLFTMITLGELGKVATSDIATRIAEYTYEKYVANADKVMFDMDEKSDDELLDNIVCMNIMLTGLISNLSTGGKQLAIAHNFYDAICCLHKDIRSKYLHGELVGLALPLQIFVNGGTMEEIDACKATLQKIGCPISLMEVGFPEDEDKLEELVRYIHKKTIEDDMVLLEKIRDGIKYIM